MPSKNGENVTPSHIMTQTEWEEMMARKVLAYTTDALLVDFRYMGSAFQILQAVPDGQITTLAVDGAKLHYSAEQLIRVFRSNEKYLNRLYLHALLHCLFQHLWIGGTRDRMRWHIACDIAVEYVRLFTDGLKRRIWSRSQVSGRNFSRMITVTGQSRSRGVQCRLRCRINGSRRQGRSRWNRRDRETIRRRDSVCSRSR